MIKLPSVSEEYRKKFLDDVYPKIFQLLNENQNEPDLKKIIDYCSNKGKLDEPKIQQLLIGDFFTLKDAINHIGVIDSDDVEDKFKKEYNKFCNRKFGIGWAQMIGVTVCPYCNRSYIFTSNKKGTRPQYDHYFPKSKYPYLALSMYNLIPCCAVCNGLKHDDDTAENPIIYPYLDSYGNQVKFEANGVGHDNIASWLGAATKYEIKLQYKDGMDPYLKKRIEQAFKIFKLEDLYSKHSDYIRDILRTAYIYHDDYFEELVIQYPNLFHNKQEARDLVFFNYLEEKDWGKRVLAKLTHDIVTEANLK